MLEAVCPVCRGPLDPTYDWDELSVSRHQIETGPSNLWRYGSLLPISARDPQAGWTPLVEAPVLAAQLGIRQLWLKLETAHAPRRDARLKAVASAVAEIYGIDVDSDWLRLAPYAAEGAKTVAFEIVEQLGWRFPCVLVAPVATGRLLIKLGQGFDELERVGLLAGSTPRLLGARPLGAPLLGSDGELALATAAAARGGIIFVPPPIGVQVLLDVAREGIRTGAISPSNTVVLVLTGNGPTTPREVNLLVDRSDIVI
jgi:threonine synthase